MRKPIIVINTPAKNYKGLIVLGNSVLDSMTSNPNFSSPSPSLLVLADALTEVKQAAAKWGGTGNRGSTADRLDLQVKSIVLAGVLKAMSQYVQITAQLAAGNIYSTMAVIMGSSGFALRKENSPQGVVQSVRGLRRMIMRNLNQNQVMLRWLKPFEVTSYNNIKLFKVYKGFTGNFTEAKLIATTTKTSFIDTNNSSSTVKWFYWIVPVSTAGDGVVSKALPVDVLGR